MLESVYARVMIFLFARVHIQSAYHLEQTHFEQFPCITSEQYLVWDIVEHYRIHGNVNTCAHQHYCPS